MRNVPALKGRNKVPDDTLVMPFQGVVHLRDLIPRAMPWALMFLPRSGRNANSATSIRASEGIANALALTMAIHSLARRARIDRHRRHGERNLRPNRLIIKR